MKYLSLVLSVLLIFCFVGCNADTTVSDSSSPSDTTENTTEEIIQSHLLKVRGMRFGLERLQISEEQSNSVKEIWESCEWIDDVTETVYDYVFIDGEREVRYSYDAGIFNDVTNMRSVFLTNELHTEMNNIIDHLIVLPVVD